jgi:hypothetical protein
MDGLFCWAFAATLFPETRDFGPTDWFELEPHTGTAAIEIIRIVVTIALGIIPASYETAVHG